MVVALVVALVLDLALIAVLVLAPQEAVPVPRALVVPARGLALAPAPKVPVVPEVQLVAPEVTLVEVRRVAAVLLAVQVQELGLALAPGRVLEAAAAAAVEAACRNTVWTATAKTTCTLKLVNNR